VNEGHIAPEKLTPDTLAMAHVWRSSSWQDTESVGTVLLPQDAQARARTVASILVKT